MNTIKTIGIVALSSPTIGKRKKRVRDSIAYLKKQGFMVEIGSSVFSQQAYRSADIATRTSDVMNFFMNPKIDCIMSTTGGYNSNDILEFLDYSIIKKNPKWFIGYSDITSLNLALYKQSNIQTINGPMLVDFADDPTIFNRLFASIDSKTNDFTFAEKIWEWERENKRVTPKPQFLPNKKKTCSGKLLAGNLSTFVLLLGTNYIPDTKNSILFLEYDICETEALASLQRMLRQIRQNGIFEKIKGLVIGTLPEKAKSEEASYWGIRDILNEVTKSYDFPVLFNAPFGHLYPSWILINGTTVKIRTLGTDACFETGK